MKKYSILLWLIFFIMPIIFVNAQISSVVQYVDPEILEEFNQSSEVMVLVKLYSENITKVNEVLSTLPESEFKLRKKLQSGRGFSGNITIDGFNRLTNNPNIEIIWLNKPLHVVNEDEKIEEIESKIIKNDSVSKNLSIPEKEQKLETPRGLYEVKEIGGLERNNLLFLWITVFVFMSIITGYLIIKFSKKVKRDE